MMSLLSGVACALGELRSAHNCEGTKERARAEAGRRLCCGGKICWSREKQAFAIGRPSGVGRRGRGCCSGGVEGSSFGGLERAPPLVLPIPARLHAQERIFCADTVQKASPPSATLPPSAITLLSLCSHPFFSFCFIDWVYNCAPQFTDSLRLRFDRTVASPLDTRPSKFDFSTAPPALI